MIKENLDLTALKKSIISLEKIVNKVNDLVLMDSFDDDIRNGLKSGVIQNFEIAYEICWKFMKRWIENNIDSAIVDGVTRRELFRISAENFLINDVEKWMFYHYARNNTSHIYNENIAEEVYEKAKEFIIDAKNFLEKLEAKN
jgi:nucleotidyltransferase substrate binding protein (TIGR01987 family)